MNSMFSLVVLDYSQKEKTWLYESKKFLYVKFDCNVSLAKKSFKCSGCVSMGSMGSTETMDFQKRVPEAMDFGKIYMQFQWYMVSRGK